MKYTKWEKNPTYVHKHDVARSTWNLRHYWSQEGTHLNPWRCWSLAVIRLNPWSCWSQADTYLNPWCRWSQADAHLNLCRCWSQVDTHVKSLVLLASGWDPPEILGVVEVPVWQAPEILGVLETPGWNPPKIPGIVEVPGWGVADYVTVCWFLHDGPCPERIWHRLKAQRHEEILSRLEHFLHGVILESR